MSGCNGATAHRPQLRGKLAELVFGEGRLLGERLLDVLAQYGSAQVAPSRLKVGVVVLS